MDDTVILSASNDMCMKKLEVLMEYSSEYGMVVSKKKTKFFVINGEERDKYSLIVK